MWGYLFSLIYRLSCRTTLLEIGVYSLHGSKSNES
jgi:hypothetical protein